VFLRHSDAVAESDDAGMMRAVCATKYLLALLDPVADDPASTMGTGWSQGVNRALE